MEELTEGQRCWLEIASDIFDARVAEGWSSSTARRFAKGHFKVRVCMEGYGDVSIYRTLFELTDMGWFEESRPGTFVLSDLRLCRYGDTGSPHPPRPPGKMRLSNPGAWPAASEAFSRLEMLAASDGRKFEDPFEKDAIDQVLRVEVFDHLRKRFVLDWRGIHGVVHWICVLYEGLRLASEVGADQRVVAWFAVLHDVCLQSDGFDPEHGDRALFEVNELAASGLLDLDGTALGCLAEAIGDHSKGRVHEDPTIACCWDADRLDLVRLGVQPDLALLSTAAARVRAASLQSDAHQLSEDENRGG